MDFAVRDLGFGFGFGFAFGFGFLIRFSHSFHLLQVMYDKLLRQYILYKYIYFIYIINIYIRYIEFTLLQKVLLFIVSIYIVGILLFFWPRLSTLTCGLRCTFWLYLTYIHIYMRLICPMWRMVLLVHAGNASVATRIRISARIPRHVGRWILKIRVYCAFYILILILFLFHFGSFASLGYTNVYFHLFVY